ncbi:DUF1304 domain-containing protein [Colwellia sp. D2M02]|uniref:DUF1304 domain-containing protein n=1 Tax=Colwellia sp. D2M02 TaxID=2841562 RepID=UPI001C0A5D12|nr:DUF1304 domain-containing protein [Colwellia sp. D2M02]MBU2893507.1 DUF1304 domain-containing protein [Colwellia sp. D2M02]
MEYLSTLLVAVVALEHFYILVLEMFLWTKPRTRKIFGIAPENVAITKKMAANQGLYNGFLAVGLLWSLLHPEPFFALQLKIFFLSCVLVAALYGGFSVKKNILLIQGLPALLALVSLFLV